MVIFQMSTCSYDSPVTVFKLLIATCNYYLDSYFDETSGKTTVVTYRSLESAYVDQVSLHVCVLAG